MSKYSENRLFSMENSRLREIYKTIKTTKSRLSKFPVFLSIPGVLFFLLLGWQFLINLKSDMLTMLFDCSITGALDFVIFGICGIMITSDDNKFIAALPVVYALLVLIKYLLFGTFAGITIFMFVYFVLACIRIYKDNKTLKIMKTMNIFPFMRKDDGRKPTVENTADIDEVLSKFN